MGYSTDFRGEIKLNKKLDDNTAELIRGISMTRRMIRNVPSEFGVDGEFYIKDDMLGVLDENRPPSTQPGLWMDWTVTDDNNAIEWSGAEKFYYYIEWLVYLRDRVLLPKGYGFVEGSVILWAGEDSFDLGKIEIGKNNEILISTIKNEYLLAEKY